MYVTDRREVWVDSPIPCEPFLPRLLVRGGVPGPLPSLSHPDTH